MELPSPDFERVVKAAEGGDPQAMLRVADYYYQGDLVKKNFKKSMQWYRRAAEHGLSKAEFGLGLCYASGHGEKVDFNEAVKWYRKATDKGHTEATWKLAECYRHGTGVAKDELEAVKLYRKAAEAGHDRAQCTLGYQIEHGQGVAKDMTEAIEWYRKAGENGNATAQLNLALCYDNGRGVTADPITAFQWFLKAAERGNVRAQHRVGLAYETARGVGKDISQALSWYHKAADNDSGESWNRIGRIYDYGDGVIQDQVEAIRCYKLASEFGHAPAAAAVAFAYEMGQAVGKDLSQAARWYRKGAEGNDLKCLFKLAEFYELGKGMKVDAAEALRWYVKAAEKGSEEALQWLSNAKLTPPHLKEAEKALQQKEGATPKVSPPSPPLSAPLSKSGKKNNGNNSNGNSNNGTNNGSSSSSSSSSSAASNSNNIGNSASGGSARGIPVTSAMSTTTSSFPATSSASQMPVSAASQSLMRNYDESLVYQLVVLLPSSSGITVEKAAKAIIHILRSRLDERPSYPVPEPEPVESLLTSNDLQTVLTAHKDRLQSFFYSLNEEVTRETTGWEPLTQRIAQRLRELRTAIDGEVDKTTSRLREAAEFVRLIQCSNCELPLVPPVYQCAEAHVFCGACKHRLGACSVCHTDFAKSLPQPVHNTTVEKVISMFTVACPYQCGAVLSYGEGYYHDKQCSLRPFACPENWRTAHGWLGIWPGDSETCTWLGAASEVVSHCLTHHGMPLLQNDPLACEFDVTGPAPFTDSWQWRGAAIAGRLFVCCLVRQLDGSARCFGLKASEERREDEMYKMAFTVGSPDEMAVIGATLPLYSTRSPAPYGAAIDFELSQRMISRLAPDGKLRALFRFYGVTAAPKQ